MNETRNSTETPDLIERRALIEELKRLARETSFPETWLAEVERLVRDAPAVREEES